MTNYFKAVVVVYKPVHQWQIASIIRDYQVSSLVICYQADDKRLDSEEIRSWPSVKKFHGEIILEPLVFSSLTKQSFKDFLLAQEDIHLLAVPLLVGYKFWGNVTWAKTKNIVVINVFDGSVENTTIKDTFLKLKTRSNNFYSMIKMFILPKIIFLLGRADITYSPYYPLYKSAFSKKTLSEMNDGNDEKIKSLHQILGSRNISDKYLMIAGYESKVDYISSIYGNNFIATTKDKAIIIDGEKIDLPFYICVEELLYVFKPKFAIGYVSDAIVAVNTRYADVPCIAIRSQIITKTWGDLYNEIYEKQTRLFNIKVVNLEDLELLKDEFN